MKRLQSANRAASHSTDDSLTARDFEGSLAMAGAPATAA